MDRTFRRCSLKPKDFEKKRVEDGDGGESVPGRDERLEFSEYDDYENQDNEDYVHAVDPPENFGWVNGLGIVAGVAGLFFGIPIFF